MPMHAKYDESSSTWNTVLKFLGLSNETPIIELQDIPKVPVKAADMPAVRQTEEASAQEQKSLTQIADRRLSTLEQRRVAAQEERKKLAQELEDIIKQKSSETLEDLYHEKVLKLSYLESAAAVDIELEQSEKQEIKSQINKYQEKINATTQEDAKAISIVQELGKRAPLENDKIFLTAYLKKHFPDLDEKYFKLFKFDFLIPRTQQTIFPFAPAKDYVPREKSHRRIPTKDSGPWKIRKGHCSERND